MPILCSPKTILFPITMDLSSLLLRSLSLSCPQQLKINSQDFSLRPKTWYHCAKPSLKWVGLNLELLSKPIIRRHPVSQTTRLFSYAPRLWTCVYIVYAAANIRVNSSTIELLAPPTWPTTAPSTIHPCITSLTNRLMR